MKKNLSIFIILCTIVLSPFASGRIAYVNGAGLVPNCGTLSTTEVKNGEGKMIEGKTIGNPCDFGDLMELINNIINFLLFVIATPLVAIILCYCGFLLLTSGGSSEEMAKVKHIFLNVIFGYVIALIAWLLIKTILTTVGFNPKDAFLIEF